MDKTRLTVDLVERLQITANRGRPIARFVEQLEEVTLAGLVEYGCLRFAFADRVPQLNSTVAATELCRALSRVSTALWYAKHRGHAPVSSAANAASSRVLHVEFGNRLGVDRVGNVFVSIREGSEKYRVSQQNCRKSERCTVRDGIKCRHSRQDTDTNTDRVLGRRELRNSVSRISESESLRAFDRASVTCI